MRGKQISVAMKPAVANGFTKYAQATGVSVETIITQALEDWWETLGEARLATVTGITALSR